MCGIVGIFDLTGAREIDSDLLHRMNESQFHRGPDGGGLHLEAGLGLGHRRLSIIDIAAGHQPIFNEDDTVAVTYNGEIYNFVELAEELKACGHIFKTHCDTEVIVHAWEEWGESCVERFRGMFAFAIWDRNQETLFLARDRLGIKPLMYTVTDDGYFAFSSELKALRTLDGLDRHVDITAVEDYFALGYIPDPKSIYAAVHKLNPGHTLLLKRGSKSPEPRQYWDVQFSDNQLSDVGIANEQAAIKELEARVREAVQVRMVAEVPLGAFLSGGVDSSAVVAMMAGLQKDAVNTCSIGFDVESYDETEYARRVAERYKTNHYQKTVDSNAFDLIDKLTDLYDEPYADSSAIPTYRVCQLAKERVTVSLSGDGGDEIFAGYRRQRLHRNEERLRSLIPLAIRRPLFGLLGRIYPKLDWAPQFLRAKTTFQALSQSSEEAYFHAVSKSTEQQRQALFSQEAKQSLKGYSALDLFKHYYHKSGSQDPLSKIQYLDIKTWLAGDILTKVDRASMAHALEVRVPLLDHTLIEWAATLPSGIKLKDGEGKYLLKKSMEPHLPEDILYRPKMGFGVPLCDWFRGPLKTRLKESLDNGVLAKTGLFNMEYIEQLVSQHQSGVRDHSSILWSILMFESSCRKLDLVV